MENKIKKEEYWEEEHQKTIDFHMKYGEYKSALESIELLTKGSSNGEIFKIHEIVKKVLE
jgi:hypothetical protein